MAEHISEIQDWFKQRIRLICDPYFDREFFTNLIYLIDRKKSLSEIFEAAVQEIDETGEFTEETDRALCHLFYAYKAANFLRESYQWLPLAGGLYGLAMYRGNANKPLQLSGREPIPSQASTIEEFQSQIRLEARRVSSYEKAWSSFQFLLENRSTRSRALSVLVQSLIYEGDLLSVALLTQACDASFATGWKKHSVLMRRAFERFWEEGKDFEVSEFYQKALNIEKARPIEFKRGAPAVWKDEYSEEFWHRVSEESLESAWEFLSQLAADGLSLDQVLCLLDLGRGRAFFGMRADQWPIVTKSLLYADAIRTAVRWSPDKASLYLGASLANLVDCAQRISKVRATHFSGDLPYVLSKDVSKNQLILRLDDACERGDEGEALRLMNILVTNRELSHSLADRLVLMASKQDVWTYDFSTIPVAFVLTQAYQESIRLKMESRLARDALFGLLRYLSDQRAESLDEVKATGNYGDGGLPLSPFDVSGGARIVDRFVFNQMRNAQRIFVWPTEGKG